MSDNDPKTNTEAVQRIVEKYHECKGLTVLDPIAGNTASFVCVPQGVQLLPLKPFLDAYLERPERVKGVARLTDLDSLVAHALRFKSEHSVAFAHEASDGGGALTPALMVVYDYHEPAEVVELDETLPPPPPEQEGTRINGNATMRLGDADWCQHRALYKFPLSDEWVAWNAATKPMTQKEFAEFIEDRIADVCDANFTGLAKAKEFAEQLGIELASPAKLMTLSRGLVMRVDTRVAQAVNLGTGEAQILFEEEHKTEAGQQLKVPGGFAIAIPVFRNGAHYSIPVRLRYRVQGGHISWWVGLHGVSRILKHAVDEAVQMFAKDTGIPVLYGSPEA